MTAIKAFTQRHALLAYLALTFAISWGGMLLVIGGPAGIPATAEEFETLLPLAIPSMLAGPSVSGLLLTGLVYGSAGLRELLSRLLRWQAGGRWYAVALLAAPLVFTVVHMTLSLASPAFLPGLVTTGDKVPLLLSGLMAGLMVGICEELGWTGFAVPRLRLRHGVFATGLVVGVLWGAWHLLAHDFWAASISAGRLSPALYAALNGLILLAGQLPAFRVLMVWVYERTGSLLVAILMHMSLTASTFILGPSTLALSGMPLLAYGLALAAAWWVVVGAVTLVRGRRISSEPLARQAA